MMRIKHFLLVIGIIAHISGWGTEADSLRQALALAPKTEHARILNQLARSLISQDPTQAQNHAVQAERLATGLGQYAEAANALRLQGNIQYMGKKYSQALDLFKKALSYALKTNDHELLGDIYNNIGQTQIHTGDLIQAEANLSKALVHRKQLITRDKEIASIISLGQVYWEKRDYHKALAQYKAAATLLDKTENIILSSTNYNNMGNAYLQTGDTANALDAYIRSLELKKRFGGDREIAAASHSIGNLFYRIGEHDKALKHYLNAKQFYQKSGAVDQASQVDGNIGVVYNAMGKYEKALGYHQSALAFYRTQDMKEETAKTLNNLGNVYKNKESYSRAINYYKLSLELKTDLKDWEGMAVSQMNLGESYFQIKDHQSALAYATAALEISKSLNNKPLLANNYRLLSRFQAALGKHAEAYEALERFVELDQDIHTHEGQLAVAELLNRLEIQEKVQEISDLRGEQQQKEAELKRLARQRVQFIIASLLGSLFTISLIILYRQKRREIAISHKLREELESLNQELEERISCEMEKFKLQQQAINQKSKLESLGILAAGIAHEINQPLSAISMSIDNIDYKARSDKIDTGYLGKKSESMRADVDRIQKIIQHVRLFSRIQSEETIEHVDINATIGEAVTIFEPVMRKHQIALKAELCQEQILVLGNRFKLEQVLFNLFSNAKDSIVDKAGSDPGGMSGNIWISSSRAGERVIILVSDDGTGIPPDHLGKIFDPFFTTKQPDKGTGLGLAVSYGIIVDMDGVMSVRSTPGEGSVFEIGLPLIEVHS